MKQWAKKKKFFLIDFKNPLRENKGKQEEEERMEKMILPEVESGWGVQRQPEHMGTVSVGSSTWVAPEAASPLSDQVGQNSWVRETVPSLILKWELAVLSRLESSGKTDHACYWRPVSWQGRELPGLLECGLALCIQMKDANLLGITLLGI